jgi:hypothetical protein
MQLDGTVRFYVGTAMEGKKQTLLEGYIWDGEADHSNHHPTPAFHSIFSSSTLSLAIQLVCGLINPSLVFSAKLSY